MRPSKVKFISEKLEKEFKSLDENDPLKKAIKRAILDLQQNAFYGIQIPKRLFPQEYVLKYNDDLNADNGGNWLKFETLYGQLVSLHAPYFDIIFAAWVISNPESFKEESPPIALPQ